MQSRIGYTKHDRVGFWSYARVLIVCAALNFVAKWLNERDYAIVKPRLNRLFKEWGDHYPSKHRKLVPANSDGRPTVARYN